jgi:hypothetical protein
LTNDDRKQGQSYANQLTPRPPLVVVTNGNTTRIYDSSTGSIWRPGTAAGQAVERLFENAAAVAAAGLSWAIEILMGPAADLEELAEAGFGPRLRILASVDETRPLLVGSNHRQQTALAALAKEIEVKPLDDAEFERARRILYARRVALLNGSKFAIEYRAPWVLRTLAAKAAASPRYADVTLAAAMPPSLGMGFVLYDRERLAHYPEAQRGYRLLARDLVADPVPGSAELKLGRAHSFLLRRDALSSESRECLQQLIESGWVSAYRHAGGEDVVAPRAPELFLSEFAEAMSVELESRVGDDAREGAHWLADRLEAMFLGDLIGAQAIVDLARRGRQISDDLVSGLLERSPVVKTLGPSTFGFSRADGSIQNFQITTEGKAFLVDDSGIRIGEAIELTEADRRVRGELAGWMILAQLARLPSAVGPDDSARVDLSLLLEIGTCPFPLMPPTADPVGHLVHEIPGHGEVLCNENGIAESITASMLQVLSMEWRDLDAWIEAAIARRSLPLLSRIQIALQQVRRNADDRISRWADETLRARIEPAMRELLSEVEGP